MKKYFLFALFFISAQASALFCESALLPASLPVIKQHHNGQCGPTSLSIALAYFGRLPYMQNIFVPQWMTERVMTTHILRTGRTPSNILDIGIALNDGNNLAATANIFGLYAKSETASLTQIASYIARGEVVLVHWLMGPEAFDMHWSVFQGISSTLTHLRDPWPTMPDDHFITTIDFLQKTTNGLGNGTFSIVRVSSLPVY